MSKLDEAEQRLQQAILGFEEAARAVSVSAISYRADNDVELETARARSKELKNVNTEIAQRLDDAISQIKEILGD
jgi:hypothetical protein